MAPEQALGDRPTDARTDIYAVGCLAYWLVTGQHVFAGRTPIDAIVKHVHKSPEAPSRHTRVALSDGFDDLVLACLAKDPGERPSSADAVSARLHDLVAMESWTQADAHGWWNRHSPRKST